MIKVSDEQIIKIKAADSDKLSCEAEEGLGNLFMGRIVLKGKDTTSKTVARSNYDYSNEDDALDAAKDKLTEILEEEPKKKDKKMKTKKASPKKKAASKKKTTTKKKKA